MNQPRKTVGSIIIASVVGLSMLLFGAASVAGLWMLLFRFFVQVLESGMVAHDVEVVFEDSASHGKNHCYAGDRPLVCFDDWILWPEALN